MSPPLDPARLGDLRRLLARHHVRPKKSFGQSFLVDPDLRDRIVQAAGVLPKGEVLEIGAGPGTLTVRLAELTGRLLAVELDSGLVRVLNDVLRGRSGVEVIAADILKVRLQDHFPDGREVVVGNIPYYLTGALLPRLLEARPPPRRVALVVQAEVAQRWTGASGWSLATVAAMVFAEPRLEFRLPADAFWPAPLVESALVVLEVRDSPLVGPAQQPGFFRLVEAVFQLRRKQLGGSLARVARIPGSESAKRLEAAGIDPARRPETLDVAEWQAVHSAFWPLS